MFGDMVAYAVPVGAEVLVINGVDLDWFASGLRLDTPAAAPLLVGQVAMTRPGQSWELWNDAVGGERVAERPALHGGAFVSILASDTRAVRVRTSEGLTGWLRASATDALTTPLALVGEQARFTPFGRARVAEGYRIPLRERPRSAAPRRGELLQAGQEITVIGVRGDWLRVYSPTHGEGWARWYYDGTRYIDAVGQ